MQQRDFGRYLKGIMKSISRKIDQRVGEHGLTDVQGRLIGFLARKEKYGVEVFQRDIEEEFRVRRSSVTSVLQLLEKNEYITRESVAKDARLKKIVLTDKGRKVHEQVYQMILSEEGKVLQVLTKEEQDQLFVLLEKLEQACENNRGGK